MSGGLVDFSGVALPCLKDKSYVVHTLGYPLGSEIVKLPEVPKALDTAIRAKAGMQQVA